MNKIVCNICGTSYPENAEQCPICGYVQSADKISSGRNGNGSYTYVKGGRFSKANVKKRNSSNVKAASAPASTKVREPVKKKGHNNIAPVILIVVLLLAIISVSGYILLRFFLPNDFIFEGFGENKRPETSQEITDDPALESPEELPADPAEEAEIATEPLSCTNVQLNATALALDITNRSFQLDVTLTPADTTDAVLYSSSDETVAIVDQSGMITAVDDGIAVITVSCGSASAECTVTCTIQEPVTEAFSLNRKEITFNSAGQSWLLYDGPISIDEITWTSDDEAVAAVENGKVTAVGNGDTTVYAAYNDQTVPCIIHCKFDAVDDGAGNITEAEGDTSKTYQLYNPHGFAEDVMISSGEKFTLMLVDENLNEVTDAQWSVKNANICTYADSTVTGVGSGTTEVTATYAGKTYTCIVRVK